MKRIGNTVSNRLFNARNVKPAIPVDIDEVDGVMERFIRQKYEQKTLSEPQSATTQHTGSSSSDDRTPQLPPKPSKRFTFSLRSTSSSLPLPRSEKSPPVSPGLDGFGLGRRGSRGSPQRRTKPSKIFGADIGGSRADNYELKLITLREMGFPDDKRNLTILKGENGNVDRAVATLIRLGEGSRASSGRSSPVPETPPKDEDYVPGINVEKNASTGAKMNPFDRLDLQEKALPPPPIEEQVFSHQATIPNNTYNPFMQPSQSTLEQNFQGLQVSQPSQLFPNTTGGYIQHNQPMTTNPFLQTYTPPPQMTYPFATPTPFAPPQVAFDQIQSIDTGTNPFLRNSPSQNFPAANPFAASINQPPMMQANGQISHFDHNQITTSQSQFISQATTLASGPTTQNPFPTAPARQLTPSNPFRASTFPLETQHLQAQGPGLFTPSNYSVSPLSSQQDQITAQGGQFNTSYQFQPVQAPQSARYDKASILALYNLTPNSNTTTQQDSVNTPTTSAEAFNQQPSYQLNVQDQSSQHQATGGVPNPAAKRSVTMPLPNTISHNPFNSTTPTVTPSVDMPAALPQSQQIQQLKSAQGPFGPRPGHESIDFTAAAGLLSGRHSPDMFAGLSARMR
jgi:hypothetical protein